MASTISICIPTIDRVDCLRQLLSALAPQAIRHSCNIYVSDKASTDGTAAYLGGMTDTKFHRHESRIPPDDNHALVAQVARADGCDCIYPLGDDDFISDGGLGLLLRVLDRTKPDLFVLNGWHTDAELRPRRSHLPDELAGCRLLIRDEVQQP